MLTREEILACNDLPSERLYIPEWSTDIYVRVMTGAESDWLQLSLRDEQGEIRKSAEWVLGFRARYVVICACNEDGSALFTLADVEALQKKSSNALERIFKVAQRLNGDTDEAIEALAKNSIPTIDAASGSV